MKDIISALLEQYETEYNYTKIAITHKDRPSYDKNCVWYAVQRCLGMAQLAQTLGASFYEVEPIFNEIKKRLMELEGRCE